MLLGGALRLSDNRRMAIDIELLLTWHPLLFLRREGCIKGFNCRKILAAISSGGGNIHPLFSVKNVWHKLTDKQGGGKVAIRNKADVLFLAADKSAADVVSGIAEVDIDVIAHLARRIKGMLD